MKNKVLIAVVMVLSFLSLEIITGVQWALENFEFTSFISKIRESCQH